MKISFASLLFVGVAIASATAMPGAWPEEQRNRALPSMSMFTGGMGGMPGMASMAGMPGMSGMASMAGMAGGSGPSGSFSNEMYLRALKASLKYYLSPLDFTGMMNRIIDMLIPLPPSFLDKLVDGSAQNAIQMMQGHGGVNGAMGAAQTMLQGQGGHAGQVGQALNAYQQIQGQSGNHAAQTSTALNAAQGMLAQKNPNAAQAAGVAAGLLNRL